MLRHEAWRSFVTRFNLQGLLMNNPEPAKPTDPQTQIRLELDDSQVQALYANFCRVSSTPEEVILDVGMNPNPTGNLPQKIQISQRVILNHYTAKRLAALLATTVQRHEQAFGPLEMDVRKRLVAEK
jgi:hypothetical protein